MQLLRIGKTTMDNLQRLSALPGMPTRGLRDRRNCFSSNSDAIANLVCHCMVRNQPKRRSQCSRIAKRMGVQSYQTAWTCLHKLRAAMVRPDRDQLSGRIEVDESYFGGRDEGGKRGRGSEKKVIVAIAVELHSPKGFGRIRMQRIPDVTEESLIPFVCGIAKTGSEIRTDGWASYNALAAHGYSHHRTVISTSGDPAHISMPAVYRVAALAKRWLLSTHQGAESISTTILMNIHFVSTDGLQSFVVYCFTALYSRPPRLPQLLIKKS